MTPRTEHGETSTGARIAFVGFVAALLSVHTLLAWLYPIVGNDWGHLTWAANHDHEAGGAWIRAFLATHFTLGDALPFALTHSRWLHALLTPLMSSALVFGIFVLSSGRLPRATWPDLLAIVLASAMLWIAQPRAGMVFLYRSFAGPHLYGAALAVWVVAAYRCNWRLARWQEVAVIVGALLVGVSSRQTATAALIGAVCLASSLSRPERSRWMWWGIAALLVGTIAGYIDTPRVSLIRVQRSAINLAVRETGELISLVGLLALAKLVVDRLVPPQRSPALPDADVALRWLLISLGLAAFALLGPQYSEATLLPASVASCVGALPILRWVATTPVLRRVLIAIAIGIHLMVWIDGLRTIVPLGREYEARIAQLQGTPHGQIAEIQPYSELRPGFWFFGEDWAAAAPRQLIAIQVFGLRDIEFPIRFRHLELNPGISLRLHANGVSARQLAAARAPTIWGSVVGNARHQFTRLVRRLQAVVGDRFTARLVVEDLAVPELRGRPLFAALYENGRQISPRVIRRVDASGRQLVRAPASIASEYPEAYVITSHRAEPAVLHEGAYTVSFTTAALHMLVVCNVEHCLLLDANVPKL